MLGAVGCTLVITSCGDASGTSVDQLIESQGGGSIDIDRDGGVSVQTEDGGMTIDEDGNFVITDADGSVVTGRADADSGEFTVESEDGSFSSGATTELPDAWPAEIPEPEGLAITNATVIGSDTDQSITVVGTAESDEFVDRYASALESAGFDEESTFSSDEMVNNVYTNGEWTVGVVSVADEGDNQVTVSVFSSS